MNHLKYAYLAFFILVFGCVTQAQEPIDTPKKVRITIFVHGIMSIKPHLSFGNIWRFLKDKVESTLYSETVMTMRRDDFFFKNQPMQEIGLHKVDINRIEKGYASGLVGRLLNEVEQLVHPETLYENHYYTFGWPGLLSARIRYLEAIPLYKDILNLVQEFRKQGIEPEVRVIGYSHGGNLCLNLGAVRQHEDVDPTLTINELILLGVPIQCETDFLINDRIFKRVYHIYSRGDRIQKLDFFSTKRFFSRRVFKQRKYFELPEKLTQVQMRMTRPVRSKKKEQDTQHCYYNLNEVPILSGKSKHLRDISPGHIELWFFSWTPSNYREHLPIAPLPLLVFLPLILATTEETLCRAQAANPKKPIIMDIRPTYEHVIVKNQKSWKDITITEFFDKATMERFARMSEPYMPDSYTNEEYDAHLACALEKAEVCHKARCPKKRRRCP